MTNLTNAFTVNLISNSSTDTFPNNTLATFTNLLPTVIDLNKSKGLWQVALLEMSWPSKIKNVTNGMIEVEYFQNEATTEFEEESDVESSPIEPSSNTSLFLPISRRRRKPSRPRANGSATRPTKMKIPQGNYQSTYTLLQKICEKIFKSKEPDSWPFEWSVSEHSQLLRVRERRSHGIEKEHEDEAGFITADTNTSEEAENSTTNKTEKRIKIVSADLKNILGVKLLSPHSKPIYPVDISGGRHTMFVYCDLIQDEVLGSKFTSLLRTVALTANTNNHSNHGDLISYQSFSNLQ